MTTTPAPRIREVYAEYAAGRISFETLMRHVDEFIERFEAQRTRGGPAPTGSAQRDT